MKKLFMFCLFVILSLGLFAQQLNTDGEPHFDKLVGIKFIKPYSPDGEDYDGVYNVTITKKGGAMTDYQHMVSGTLSLPSRGTFHHSLTVLHPLSVMLSI